MRYKQSDIRKEVINLLKRIDSREPPVDVYALARKLDLRVVSEDLDDDFSAFLIVKNGKGTIAVNQAHHENRRRFSVAHEIAHFILHCSSDNDLFVDKKMVYRRDVAASKGEVQIEVEANSFAAELLMPKSMLEEIIDEEGLDMFDDLDIFRLAKQFGVSEQALGYRIAKLGLVS